MCSPPPCLKSSRAPVGAVARLIPIRAVPTPPRASDYAPLRPRAHWRPLRRENQPLLQRTCSTTPIDDPQLSTGSSLQTRPSASHGVRSPTTSRATSFSRIRFHTRRRLPSGASGSKRSSSLTPSSWQRVSSSSQAMPSPSLGPTISSARSGASPCSHVFQEPNGASATFFFTNRSGVRLRRGSRASSTRTGQRLRCGRGRARS